MIRVAVCSDIPALLAIENASFQGDRISQRSFYHLLMRANAVTLIDEKDQQVRGYLTLLFRSTSPIARIYSIATHADFLRQGVAAKLLRVAEQLALNAQCDAMRLEIRHDNIASLTFFQAHDYQLFGEYKSYYHDGMNAHRLQKSLTHLKCAKTSSMTGIL